MKMIFGVILMFLGQMASLFMCGRDTCPIKNNTAAYVIDAICLVVYAIGFHLLVTSI